MLKKKLHLLSFMLLAATMFLAFASVAAAATTYELTRVDLYEYSNRVERVRISSDDIKTNMEQSVEWRRVLITPRISNGEVRISGDNVKQNSDDEYYVTLDEGESTSVTIAIYDDNDKRQKRYYLELTRGGTGLEKVVFTGDDYEKTVTKIKTTNELLIPMSETELRLKAYPENEDYTLECNGSTSKKNTWDISVPKNKTVTVELVLYNSDDEEVASYEFEISRSADAENSGTTLELLDKLKVKSTDGKAYDLFPAFNNATTEYYVCFPSDVRNAVIIPTLGSDAESVKVNNKTVRSGNESGSLSVTTGGSTYTVRVTDEDGDTHDYSITLIRANRNSGSSATIEKLRVKRGTTKSESNMKEIDLSPEFDEYTEHYDLTAGTDSAYFSFRAQLCDSDCLALFSDGDTITMLEDNTYSSALQLEADDTVKIRVYSPSYENYTDYSFDVEGRKLDSNAYLDELVLYVDGVAVNLKPAFDDRTYAYTATVGKNADVFTVTPTAEESTSTITVMGDEIKSGRTSDEYSIGNSFTNVPVVVTAEDGTSNTYRLTITRSATAGNTDNTNNNNNTGNTNNTGSNTNKVVIDENFKVVFRVGNVTYIDNGKSKKLAAAPYITSSRAQVPLRVVAEALGAGVNYNPTAKQITINVGTERIYMDIGKTIKDFDVAPEVKANTTFVPIRYVSEKLGCKCTYNNASKEIVITAPTDDDK